MLGDDSEGVERRVRGYQQVCRKVSENMLGDDSEGRMFFVSTGFRKR